MIVSAVTAASSLEAARSVAPHLTGNPYYLDINSVSPGRKKETAALLGARARYVDVAVVAAIKPKRHRTPLLIAGPHAQAVAPLLREMEMQLDVVGDALGAAAAIKMIRSVMIKGIEALTLECFLAASRAGVLDEVTASLKNNYPGLDWAQLSEYNLERMASHGERRAAEMEESAATLRELGLDPLMVDATVKRQREMGAVGKDETVRQTLDKGRAAMLAAIGAAQKSQAIAGFLNACSDYPRRTSRKFLVTCLCCPLLSPRLTMLGGNDEAEDNRLCRVNRRRRFRPRARLGHDRTSQRQEESGRAAAAADGVPL